MSDYIHEVMDGDCRHENYGHRHHEHGHEHMHGFSLPEQVNKLHRKVDDMSCFLQDIDNRADGVIRRIEKSAYYNGAYYNKDIKRQDLFDAVSGCAYTLFTIPECDESHKEIQFDLKLAYGDATNSGVREDIYKAGLHHLSDKIFTAGADAKFTGVVTYKGAPIVGDDASYTLGFTKEGAMKWYRPAISRDILRQDRIVNSHGIAGILVHSQVKTSDDYGVNATEKCTRVGLGINYGSRDRYLMVVSDFDTRNATSGQNTGMTADQMADIMVQFCNMAVCVSATKQGDVSDAACLDKGRMVTEFPDALIPDNVAFWSISKKRRYNNEFTRDMGYLWQLYGELDYYYRLELDGIQVLIQRLLDVETRLTALENRVDNIEDEIEAINAEIDQIQTDLTQLRNDFDAFVITVNNKFDNLDAEILAIQNTISEMQASISEMDQVIQGVQTAISEVQTDIEMLKGQFNTLQENFDDLRAYINGLPKGDYIYKFDTQANGLAWLNANLTDGDAPNNVVVFAMEADTFRIARYSRSGTVWSMATEDNNPIDYNFISGDTKTQIYAYRGTLQYGVANILDINNSNPMLQLGYDFTDVGGSQRFGLYYNGNLPNVLHDYSSMDYVLSLNPDGFNIDYSNIPATVAVGTVMSSNSAIQLVPSINVQPVSGGKIEVKIGVFNDTYALNYEFILDFDAPEIGVTVFGTVTVREFT